MTTFSGHHNDLQPHPSFYPFFITVLKSNAFQIFLEGYHVCGMFSQEGVGVIAPPRPPSCSSALTLDFLERGHVLIFTNMGILTLKGVR